MTGPPGPFLLYSSFNEARASQLASTMTVILHRLFEQTPDGVVRHCGFTGPDLEEALLWQKEMQECFPQNCHWTTPVTRPTATIR